MGLYETRVEPCLDLVRELACAGLTNEDIADRFNIKEKAFARYVQDYPALSRAINQGRRKMILRVEDAVYKQAVGEAETVEIRKRRKRCGREADGTPRFELVVDQEVVKKGANLEAAKYYLEQREPSRWKSRLPVTDDKGLEVLDDMMRKIDAVMNVSADGTGGDEDDWGE